MGAATTVHAVLHDAQGDLNSLHGENALGTLVSFVLLLVHQAESNGHSRPAREDTVLRLQDELRQILVKEKETDRASCDSPTGSRDPELLRAEKGDHHLAPSPSGRDQH